MIEAIEYKQLKWQHITNPTEEDYDYLLETYDFHPLDIEDCKSNNQRPKIDEYDDYYFLILHFPYFEKGGKFIRVREVKIFWGRDYIITIGKPHWAVKQYFDDLRQDINEQDEDAQEAMGCSDLLLYNILNRLMTETYTPVMRVGSEVDLEHLDDAKEHHPAEHDVQATTASAAHVRERWHQGLCESRCAGHGGLLGQHTGPVPEDVRLD